MEQHREASRRGGLKQKGRPKSPEHRAKISAFHKGRKLTDEHKAAISAGNKGRVVSKETRAKISAARQASNKAKGPRWIVDANGCWIWQWSLTKGGYPAGTYRRELYEAKHGKVRKGYELHHDCEVPACVNPDHQRAMTKKQHDRYHEIVRKGSN